MASTQGQESYLELERYLVKAEADFGAALKPLGHGGSDNSGKPPRVPPLVKSSSSWRFHSEVSKGINRISSAFTRVDPTTTAKGVQNRPVPLPRHRKIRDSNPTVDANLDTGGSVRRLAAKYTQETTPKAKLDSQQQSSSPPPTSPVRYRTKPTASDSQFRWSQGSKLNDTEAQQWPASKRYLSYVDVVRPQSLALSSSNVNSSSVSSTGHQQTQRSSAWSTSTVVGSQQRTTSEQSVLTSTSAVDTYQKRIAPLTQRRSFISETRRSAKEEELSGKSFAPLSPICGSPTPRTPRATSSPRNFVFPDSNQGSSRVILRPNPKVLRVAPMASARDYSLASEPDLRLDTTAGGGGNMGGSKSSFRLSASSFSAFKPLKENAVVTRGISNSVATLDFTDLDSISKWTSSVLAELESIDSANNLSESEGQQSDSRDAQSMSLSFANMSDDSNLSWPSATGSVAKRGSSVPPRRSEERPSLQQSLEDISDVPIEAKLTLEKALEDLQHIDTFSRQSRGRSNGQRVKPQPFPLRETNVLQSNRLSKPLLNGQSNTWPTPVTAQSESGVEPLSDREISYKCLTEPSYRTPMTIQISMTSTTESSGTAQMDDSLQTPLASPSEVNSVGGVTPVPSESYQADDETRDDLNSPSPRPTYFQPQEEIKKGSGEPAVNQVAVGTVAKEQNDRWTDQLPPKPTPRTSITKKLSDKPSVPLSTVVKPPKKDVSVGVQGDSLKTTASGNNDNRKDPLADHSNEFIRGDRNHNHQRQQIVGSSQRGSFPPVAVSPVKLRCNQQPFTSETQSDRFSHPSSTTTTTVNPQPPKGRRSVHGVVESIIRQVQSHVPFALHTDQLRSTQEDSTSARSIQQHDNNDNFTGYQQSSSSPLSPDDNSWPEVSDAFTQTSPVSLSRSSSFTWLSDLEVYNDSDQRHSFMLDVQMDNYRSEAHLQMRQLFAEERQNSAYSSTLVDVSDQQEDLSDSSTDDADNSNEQNGADTQQLSRSYENDSQLLSELSGVASSEEDDFSIATRPCDYESSQSYQMRSSQFAQQHSVAGGGIYPGTEEIRLLQQSSNNNVDMRTTGDRGEPSRLAASLSASQKRNSITEARDSSSSKSNSDDLQINRRRSIPPSLAGSGASGGRIAASEESQPHGQIPRMGMINTERQSKFESSRLGGPHLDCSDNCGDAISEGRRFGGCGLEAERRNTKLGSSGNCLPPALSNESSGDLSAGSFRSFNGSLPSETGNTARVVPTGVVPTRHTLSVGGSRMECAEMRRKSLELTLSQAYCSSGSPNHRCSEPGLTGAELSAKGRQALQEAQSVLMSITRAEREWLSVSPSESNGTATSVESPFESVSVTSTPITPAEGFSTRGPMPRDMSLASGILADNESSPLSPEQQRFAILNASDASASAITSPESAISSFAVVDPTKSFESSNGRPAGFGHENFFYSERSAKLKAEAEEILMATSMIETTTTALSQHQQANPPFPLMLKDDKSAGMTSSLPTLDRITGAASAEDLQGGRMGSPATLTQTPDIQTGANSNKEKAESEARECCRWLRAAGFPQYAQMYEDHLFPVDISAVQRDHEFLDQDSLEALYRRLLTLNRCAVMKIDSFLHNTPDDDSDDEDVAISRQWRYQRKSRTWSRVPPEFADPSLSGSSPTGRMANLRDDSAESVGITATESFELQHYSRSDSNSQPSATALTTTSPLTQLTTVKRDGLMAQSLLVGIAHTTEDIEMNDAKPTGKVNSKLQRSSSERIKNKAKAFVRRIDNMRSGSQRRSAKKGPNDGAAMEIGSPVLVSHTSAGPASMQMLANCSQLPSVSGIAHVSRDRSAPPPREFASNSRPAFGRSVSPRHQPWRYGKIFLTSSDSSSVEFVTDRDSKLRQSGEVFADRPTGGHTATFILDANSNNIDKIFLPNLPKNSDRSSGSSPLTVVNGGSNNSLTRCGIRTNAKFRPDAQRLGSPQIGRKGNESATVMRDGVPLVLFNPTYEMTPVERTVVSGNRSVASWRNERLKQDRKFPSDGVDSSPDFSSRSTPTGNSLRVQVDVEQHSNGLNHGVLTHSSLDSSDTDSPKHWERRDSGVGSSLSRSPSVPAKPRVRWHSFQRQQKQNHLGILSPAIDSLSVTQLTTLQKFALLKLTALMEKYSHTTRNSNWNWGVTRFLKKMKLADYKGIKDQQVFGVPFFVIAQRTGQPLPQCILQAMKFLRQQAPDALGMFRKPGVRSRIAKLKFQCESSADLLSFESSQAYDVADMVKQYFRELPEPVMTSKLSETFLAIQQYLPPHLRLEAMQKAILLLPDENREVLQTLLMFLYDIAMHCETNQMTAQNLAVCFAPTLFQLSPRVGAMSPTRRHKTIGGGMPNEKELSENCAAQQILADMIRDCRKLFTVPGDILMKCSVSLAEDVEPALLRQLGSPEGNYFTYLDGCVDALVKEHREKWRGWVTAGSVDGVEISSKKVHSDDYPLRLWRCWADVEAPPKELLSRVIRERELWDDDIVKWRVVSKLADNCELFQYVCNDMPPHPTRDYLVIRLWRTDVPELRGGCVLVETSVTVPEVSALGGIRGTILASRCLIEPSGSGRSRITHVGRIDTRGRSKSWYSKVFGHVCGSHIARIRDSFRQVAEGPETKV